MQDLSERFAKMQRDAADHAASCAERVCARCGRHACPRCGASQSFEGICGACDAVRMAVRARQSALDAIPFGFHGACLEASWLVPLVGPRVIADARASLDELRVAAAGPPGSGKTSLVAAMVLAAAHPRTVWVSAHQLAKARAFHPLGEGEAPLIARAMSAGLLVVDELGGEDQRYATAVAEVLFERHAQAARTWVTTGVGPKEIADRYGGGIARRVFEDAKVFRLVGRKSGDQKP